MAKNPPIWLLGISLVGLLFLDVGMLWALIISHFKMPFRFYCAAPVVAWATWLIYSGLRKRIHANSDKQIA